MFFAYRTALAIFTDAYRYYIVFSVLKLENNCLITRYELVTCKDFFSIRIEQRNIKAYYKALVTTYE